MPNQPPENLETSSAPLAKANAKVGSKTRSKASSKTRKTSQKAIVWEAVDWEAYGVELVAGTDEVGRGCLAGPVYAAAVILRPGYKCEGLTDSKLVDPGPRAKLAEKIKAEAVAWAIGVSSVEEIEQLNILHASLLAMRRAVQALGFEPQLVLIDGDRKMGGHWRQETLIKGDLRCAPISAASIIAKVARDQQMETLDAQFPGYGFANHKGYATPEHRKAIAELGPCVVHRKTFGGVREFLHLFERRAIKPASNLDSASDRAIHEPTAVQSKLDSDRSPG